MGIKKLQGGWIRETAQENGTQVYRWYEKSSAGIIASLVNGDIPNEGEWRISGNDFDAFTVRGDRRLMERKSDADNVRMFETLLKREKMKGRWRTDQHHCVPE